MCVAFMPCEQQTHSLGLNMASIKALDGRMFYGIASWIFVWCVDAPVLISEHPRSYVEDFYDAPRRLTNLSFFGCHLLEFLRTRWYSTARVNMVKGRLLK